MGHLQIWKTIIRNLLYTVDIFCIRSTCGVEFLKPQHGFVTDFNFNMEVEICKQIVV